MNTDSPTEFNPEQKDMLRKCALELLNILEKSQLNESKQLLNGGLRNVLNQVMEADDLKPLEDVPFFSLMTRDYLPAEETKSYFNFYSMARYGELAYPITPK